MSDDLLNDVLAGAGAAVLAYAGYELLAAPEPPRGPVLEPYELYACEECGAVFVPGTGPDNIYEAAGEQRTEAARDGDCPACGASDPGMEFVSTVYGENRRDLDAGTDGGAAE